VFVLFKSQLYIVYDQKLRMQRGLLSMSLFTWMYVWVHDLYVQIIKW
jgi:hypothetical protein